MKRVKNYWVTTHWVSKTPILRSNLCDYSDAYILVKGTITVTALGANNGANNIRDKKNRP